MFCLKERRGCNSLFGILCMILFAVTASAQQGAPVKDTGDKMLIKVDRSQNISGFRTDSGDFRKIVGDVILRQGTDTLYCDSAVQNLTTKNFEAFGHVKIAQAGGTKGSS